MRAGKLRHVFTLMALKQTATGNFGASKPAYKPVAELRGSVLHVGGGDGQAGVQMVNLRTVLFETRFYPGIEATMRIEWNGAQYEIDDINDVDGLGRTLRITATRVKK
jgi:head-tail adaptor